MTFFPLLRLLVNTTHPLRCFSPRHGLYSTHICMNLRLMTCVCQPEHFAPFNAVVEHAFTSSAPEELTVVRGEHVRILASQVVASRAMSLFIESHQGARGWYLGRRGSDLAEGAVPANVLRRTAATDRIGKHARTHKHTHTHTTHARSRQHCACFSDSPSRQCTGLTGLCSLSRFTDTSLA